MTPSLPSTTGLEKHGTGKPPQTAPHCLETTQSPLPSALKCIRHIDRPVRMRRLETVSANPAQAKRITGGTMADEDLK